MGGGAAKRSVNCGGFGGGVDVIMMGFLSELEVCLGGVFLAKLVFQ